MGGNIMTKPKHRSALMNDRIQLPLNFDVDRMQEEVHALDLDSFIEYNVLPLRSPAYLVESIGKTNAILPASRIY
jgi:hypothetical protein